jgi:hypothetical protein
MKNAYSRLLPKICILLAVASLGFAGCKKALETKVNSVLTPQNFYQSEGDANAALITLYIPFSSNWGNPDPGNGTWFAALYNADIKTYFSKSLVSTDEIYNEGTDGNTAPLFNFTWGASSWTLNSGNEAVYSKITYVAKATEVIQAISQSDAVTDAVKKSYVAQAKTLRAWLMYVLFDFFGPVNAKWDYNILTDTSALARPTEAAYIAQIEKDIAEAMPDLKDKYNSDAPNWGRVGKGVARMILLKLYMQTKQWAKAEAVAKEIMTMGYSLLTGPNGYRDVFRNKANAEIIYAVPANAASPNFWVQEVLPTDFKSSANIPARAAGWLTQYMPWTYYDKYQSTDLRRTTTLIDEYVTQGNVTRTRSNGMKGAIPLKYSLIPNTTPDQPIDVMVFRYAEVLLSLAEAINEQRGPAEAYQYVNQVRARAGVSDFAGMTKDQLRTALLDERGRELYGEGTRRQDLIRNGTYVTNAVTRGKNAQAHHVLFPIPNSVIVQGRGVIQQNPGY